MRVKVVNSCFIPGDKWRQIMVSLTPRHYDRIVKLASKHDITRSAIGRGIIAAVMDDPLLFAAVMRKKPFA